MQRFICPCFEDRALFGLVGDLFKQHIGIVLVESFYLPADAVSLLFQNLNLTHLGLDADIVGNIFVCLFQLPACGICPKGFLRREVLSSGEVKEIKMFRRCEVATLIPVSLFRRRRLMDTTADTRGDKPECGKKEEYHQQFGKRSQLRLVDGEKLFFKISDTFEKLHTDSFISLSSDMIVCLLYRNFYIAVFSREHRSVYDGFCGV